MLDNSRLYDGSIPEPSQRWPDDVATCAVSTEIVASLGIVVTDARFPLLPNGIAGCGYLSPQVKFSDFAGNPHLTGMDSDGGGVNSYGVYYTVYMDKNSRVRPSRESKCNPSNCIVNLQYTDPNWSYHPPSTPDWTSKIWSFNRPIFDQSETINGLVWRHYMFWTFESLSSDPEAPALPLGSPLNPSVGSLSLAEPVVSVPYPDALESVGEVYEHVVDADHTMLVFASYDRPVTQDAHWFAARRAMLRKLVDAVTIRPLTPDLWQSLMVRYEAQVRLEGESPSEVQARAEAERIFEAHQKAEPAAGR
jgi:hypothetical protein